MIYPRTLIDTIKEKADILFIAKELGFEVIKTGNVYQARCLHGEDKPSLTFYPNTNSFYCFGCGETGDIIQFVCWVLNLDFAKGIEKLASMLNVEIKIDTRQQEAQERLYKKALSFARSCRKTLYENKDLLKYLSSRSVTDTEILRWKLGAISNDEKKIVFPIEDQLSRIIAFGYRSMNGGYTNSKDSVIFNKGSILYGLNLARKLIRKYGYAVLVEGYMDAIQLQKQEVPAVAQLGTSLTTNQAKLLSSVTRNVIIFMDGDTPGFIAAKKCSSLLESFGLSVRALTYHKDPDELAIELGKDTRKYIEEHAVSIPAFHMNRIFSEVQTKIDELTLSSLKSVLPLLMQLDNPVDMEHYIAKTAELLHIDKDTIYRMLARGEHPHHEQNRDT